MPIPDDVSTAHIDSETDDPRLWRADGLDHMQKFNELLALLRGDAGEVKATATGSTTARTLADRFADRKHVKDFGAVGDGETDDTEAIQTALNAGGIICFDGGKYRITDTLYVTVGATTIYANRMPREDASPETSAEILLTNADVDVAIHTTATNFVATGLTFTSPGKTEGRICINAVRTPPVTNASIDHSIRDCNFRGFDVAVRIEGRGLDFQGNVVADCNVGVDLDWPDGFVGDGTTGADAGMRSYHINDNRFHGIGYAVRNTGANARKIAAVNVQDNNIDIGSGVFQGVLRRGLCTGNVVNLATGASSFLYDLTDGCEDYEISGVALGGDTDAGRSPLSIFRMAGQHRRGRIVNLTAGECKRHFINILSGADVEFDLLNVTIFRPCLENATRADPVIGIAGGARARINADNIRCHIDNMPGNNVLFGGSATDVRISVGKVEFPAQKLVVMTSSFGRRSFVSLAEATTAQLVPGNNGDVALVTNGDSGNPCLAVYLNGQWRRVSIGGAI